MVLGSSRFPYPEGPVTDPVSTQGEYPVFEVVDGTVVKMFFELPQDTDMEKIIVPMMSEYIGENVA